MDDYIRPLPVMLTFFIVFLVKKVGKQYFLCEFAWNEHWFHAWFRPEPPRNLIRFRPEPHWFRPEPSSFLCEKLGVSRS